MLPIGLVLSMTAVGCSGVLPEDVTPTPVPLTLAAPSATWTPALSPTVTETPTPSATPTATLFTPSATPSVAVTPTSTPTPVIGARVNTGGVGLRLRAVPGSSGEILDLLDDGTRLQATGRTPDGSWLRVVTPQGLVGWMMTSYLALDDVPDSLVTVDLAGAVAEAPPPSTGARVAADGAGLRLHQQPDELSPVEASLDALDPLAIMGQSADGLWLRVATEADGVGWVWAEYVDVFVDLRAVPVGGGDNVSATLAAQALITPTTPPTAVAVLRPFYPNARVQEGRGGLRVRSSPGTAGAELVRLTELAELEIIGRTADNAWLEVVTPERNSGWVWAGYVQAAIDLNTVPVSGVAADAPPVAVAAVPADGGLPGPPPAIYEDVYIRAPLPVISGVSDHARAIFRQGQSLGNRANVFSKVGDSITAVDWFLYPLGWDVYDLAGHPELAPAVSYFSGATARDGNSFANESLAAYPWWTTETVLTPGQSPGGIGAGLCQPGESPLACEYRVVRPAVALIMLGTNDIHLISFAEFQRNLRQIVQLSIDRGVIPVLSTIPDQLNARGGDVRLYNEFIINTARAFDVPLWDYWGAMRGLSNYGLSEDGVHPSLAPGETRSAAVFTPENLYYGYTVRNLTALQVLDAVWRQVLN